MNTLDIHQDTLSSLINISLNIDLTMINITILVTICLSNRRQLNNLIVNSKLILF